MILSVSIALPPEMTFERTADIQVTVTSVTKAITEITMEAVQTADIRFEMIHAVALENKALVMFCVFMCLGFTYYHA